MSRFFIDRPIFAWVIAIVITLAGLLSIFTLPVEQYPNIAPPSVSIRATYTGASAETTENSVTQVIEQNMTGLDNLLYMSSSSTSAGAAQVTLTFASGTNPDIAQVQVQNKLQQAQSKLPQTVQSTGVTVTKSSGNIFMVLAFVSNNGSMDDTALRKLEDRLNYLRNLEQRRQEVKSAIEGQEKLTPELAEAIDHARTLAEVEDLEAVRYKLSTPLMQ